MIRYICIDLYRPQYEYINVTQYWFNDGKSQQAKELSIFIKGFATTFQGQKLSYNVSTDRLHRCDDS